MLAYEIKKKEIIYTVCRNTEDINYGEVFDIIQLADDTNLDFNTPVICCGNLDEKEKLFRTVDGRYYFGLRDGWGAEDRTLYGIRLGIIYDFGHPTTLESALSECDKKGTYSSFGGAIREHNRRIYRNLLKPIIKRLIETDAANNDKL